MSSNWTKPKMLDGIKFMEYLIGLQLTPSKQVVDVLCNAYDSLLDLLKFQDRTSKKRYYEGIAEIIYPAVKQEERALMEFNEIVYGDKGFLAHVKLVMERKKENPRKYYNPHTFYIGDRLRSLSYRKRYQLDEIRSLWNRNPLPPLQGYIQYLGEFYFLLTYCSKREEFFEHIDVSRKGEFIEKLLSIGKSLIQDFHALEAQERIVRGRMGSIVDEQLQVLDATSESPKGTGYKLVLMDDILEALIINLPYYMSDTIEVEDVGELTGQRYILSKVRPQMLAFQSDEGNYSISVFVREINDSYHVFSVHEEEGLAAEVVVENFECPSTFTYFFSQLINQYELPSEVNDEADEADGVMISTINDVLKVLETLID